MLNVGRVLCQALPACKQKCQCFYLKRRVWWCETMLRSLQGCGDCWRWDLQVRVDTERQQCQRHMPALLVFFGSTRLSALSSGCLAPTLAMHLPPEPENTRCDTSTSRPQVARSPLQDRVSPRADPQIIFLKKHEVGNLDCFKMPVSGQSSRKHNSTRSSKTAPWAVTYKSQITGDLPRSLQVSQMALET